MRKMRKLAAVLLVLTMLVSVCLAAPPAVYADEEGDFTFEIKADPYGYGAYVLNYCEVSNPVVPKQLGGVDVVSISLIQVLSVR